MDLWFRLACGNAILLYFAPLIAFLHARSVVAFSPYAYLFTLVASCLWIRYALDWSLDVLRRLSQFGAVTAAGYTVTFVCLSERDDPRLTYLFQFGAGGVALLVGAVGLDVLIGGRTRFYSLVCCASSCFASIAPAYNLPRAWQERSMRMMPHFSVPLLACPNAIQWIWRNVDGVASFWDIDGYPVFSAGVAGLCAAGQLLLHVLFLWQPPPPPPAAGAGLYEHLVDHGVGADHENGGLSDHSGDESIQGDNGGLLDHSDGSTHSEDDDLFDQAHETTDSEHSENLDEVSDAEHSEHADGSEEGDRFEPADEITDGKDGDRFEPAEETTEIKDGDRDNVQDASHLLGAELGNAEGEYVVHVASSSDEQLTAQPPPVQQQSEEVVIDVPADDAAV